MYIKKEREMDSMIDWKMDSKIDRKMDSKIDRKKIVR